MMMMMMTPDMLNCMPLSCQRGLASLPGLNMMLMTVMMTMTMMMMTQELWQSMGGLACSQEGQQSAAWQPGAWQPIASRGPGPGRGPGA